MEPSDTRSAEADTRAGFAVPEAARPTRRRTLAERANTQRVLCAILRSESTALRLEAASLTAELRATLDEIRRRTGKSREGR